MSGDQAPGEAKSGVFAGGGELRARCRALDWAATPLGPVEDWSPVLRTAVRLCLDAGFSTCLYAGPELVLVYNDGFVEALGRKHPEALGRPAREVWREVWAQVAPDFERVRSTGGAVFHHDQRFVLDRGAKGAEEAFYTFAFSPVRDEAGAVVGVLSTVTETTARVRAEAALSTERERLRSVILQTPAPLALVEGPEHRFVLVNDAYKRISGGGRDVTGLTPPEAFPELAGSGIYELFDRVYATGEPWDGPESPVRYDRDGTGVLDTWFDLRFEPLRDAEGRVVAILNFAVDVTEQVLARREGERLLRESERARAEADLERRRLETVLQQLPVGVVFVEAPSGRIVQANAATARIWGAAPHTAQADDYSADYTGYRPGAAVPVASHEWPIARALAAGEVVVDEAYEIVRPDGGRRIVSLSAAPVRDAEGAVLGAVVTTLDVTERERLLAAAEAARAAAEAANRAKGEFLAVMSHELRTPLNAIGGYAELIELGIHGPVTGAQRTALARIQTSQRHLLGLIAGVLDYSRVEAGAVTYRIVDVPVAEAVAEAEALVAPQLRAKGLGYAWSGAPPALAVRADREKLQQILLNLLGNAVKFTHARDGAPGRIDVTCTTPDEAAGGRVRIHVCDTGEGIGADELERIFEPFVQVDQRLTRAHAGVGLGLAISRDMARGMGGDLTVESAPGAGSVFTLELPVAGGG